MTRLVRVHDGVEEDLVEAFRYYEEHAPEHVARLHLLFLEATERLIPRMPNAYAPLFEHYRHIYLRPFRYYVAYQVSVATIDILAVRHGAQNPDAVETEIRGRRLD
jgi:plasmid stabilization system protein ParE